MGTWVLDVGVFCEGVCVRVYELNINIKGRVNPATISKPEFCILFHHFDYEYVFYHYHHK